MNEITKLDPQCIWKNFYALTQVPRPSGHLEKIQQFLLDFGKQVGVEAFKDPAENIVFRKRAAEQRGGIHPQGGAERGQQLNIRRAAASLPFGNGLVAHADFLSQLQLRHILALAQQTD